MKLTGNTILITGGGSGIGRGLAEQLLALDNKVIIAGRRQAVLDEAQKANPGLVTAVLDIDNPEAVRAFAAKITKEHPGLNVLVNNAGIMRPENFKAAPDYLADAEAVITTNLLGPIRLTAALLPHLLKQGRAAIVNVTSGLGFVPFPITPTYSATKAAMHSYSVSLRVQLADTPVEVVEIIPPAVATDLTPGRDAAGDARFMSLEDYIHDTMEAWKSDPTRKEIPVGRAVSLRYAEAGGQFDQLLAHLSSFTLPKT